MKKTNTAALGVFSCKLIEIIKRYETLSCFFEICLLELKTLVFKKIQYSDDPNTGYMTCWKNINTNPFDTYEGEC